MSLSAGANLLTSQSNVTAHYHVGGETYVQKLLNIRSVIAGEPPENVIEQVIKHPPIHGGGSRGKRVAGVTAAAAVTVAAACNDDNIGQVQGLAALAAVGQQIEEEAKVEEEEAKSKAEEDGSNIPPPLPLPPPPVAKAPGDPPEAAEANGCKWYINDSIAISSMLNCSVPEKAWWIIDPISVHMQEGCNLMKMKSPLDYFLMMFHPGSLS